MDPGRHASFVMTRVSQQIACGFISSFQTAADVLEQFLKDDALQQTLVEIGTTLTASFRGGGKVLIAGNGRSMADAMHFAEERATPLHFAVR